MQFNIHVHSISISMQCTILRLISVVQTVVLTRKLLLSSFLMIMCASSNNQVQTHN